MTGLELSEDDLKLLKQKSVFNSFEAFAASFTNLSVMMMLSNEYDLAHACCIRSLKLNPSDKEAHINMNNIMRQIGKKEMAFDYVWQRVGVTPQQVDYNSKAGKKQGAFEYGYTELIVVCVKYGTKYGADYVNKLYRGIERNLTLPHKFCCFTENAEGLDINIQVLPLEQ